MYEQIEDLTGLCKTSARFWVCVKGHGSATLPVERGKSNEATPATVYRKGNQRFFELWSRFYKIPVGELHHIDGDDDINLSAMTDEQVIGYIKYTNYLTDIEWIADYAKRQGVSELEAAREVWEYRKSIHNGVDTYDGIICGWDVIKGEQLHMDEPFVVRFSEQGAKMQVNGTTIIKEWYHKTYPTDPCWEDILCLNSAKRPIPPD